MRRAQTTATKVEPQTLKCYFPKRDKFGVVTTTTRVLCAPHRVWRFNCEPAAYACGEVCPSGSCELFPVLS